MCWQNSLYNPKIIHCAHIAGVSFSGPQLTAFEKAKISFRPRPKQIQNTNRK